MTTSLLLSVVEAVEIASISTTSNLGMKVAEHSFFSLLQLLCTRNTWNEVRDGNCNFSTTCGRPIFRANGTSDCSPHPRRHVCVGLLRKSWQGPLHEGRLHKSYRPVGEDESPAASVEGDHGFGGETRFLCRSNASHDGDLAGRPAPRRFAHAPGCL